MKRTDFKTRSVYCDNGENVSLLYSILEETADGCLSYGIQIVMHRRSHRESAVVRNITTSYERIKEIHALLCRNTVTPCTLRDIVEDELNKF